MQVYAKACDLLFEEELLEACGIQWMLKSSRSSGPAVPAAGMLHGSCLLAGD